jgi:DedD protein
MEPLYRQRLIGAMVLVAIAVVVVPLLLGEPRPIEGSGPRVAAPAPPHFEGPPSAEQRAVSGMAEPGAFPESDLAPPAPSAESLDAWLNPAAPPSSPAVTPSPAVAAAAPAASGAPDETAAGGVWVVQVGSYADVDNARKRVEQLQARAFEAWVAEPERPGGPFRVWVGPELERARAVALQQRIQREFGLEAEVRRHVSR